jgi:hypothetical protein
MAAAVWPGCGTVPGAQGGDPAITGRDMAARVAFLASDRLEGRGTPGRGLELAASYVESEFRRLRLERAAGAYVQRYPIVVRDADGGSRAESASAPNVVAILRGSDRRLREEFVLVSAHMDGLGIGAPVDGDSIYNGADDNASGSAALLEVAEALAARTPPPRRSLVFLLVSGEERGLLGSSHFVAHPPLPLERVVADLNVDMVGRNWEDTIAVVGKPYSSLGALVDSVAAAHPELGLAAVDDLWPAEGFFFRSDHFNFARKGIPAVFFFNGVHAEYHLPSDEVELINFEKAARIARLIYEVALAVANAEERPRWDPAARAQIVEEGH